MQTMSAVLPPSIVHSPTTVYAAQGDIYALEVNSGILQQHYHIQGLAKPTIVNDVLYVNVNNLSNNTIQALQGSSGVPLWSYEIEGRPSGSPTIEDEIVYTSTAEGSVYALQASDGTLLWRYEVGPVLFASPTVIDGIVYVSPAIHYPSKPCVYALQAKDGALLWHAQISDSTSFPLIVMDEVIYISTYSGCFAYRTRDLSPMWQYKTKGQPCSSPVVMNEILYISLSELTQDSSSFASGPIRHRQEASISALRAGIGSFLWRQPLGVDTGATCPTSLVGVSGIIYVGTDDGYLTALQANDGILIWRYKTGGTWLSSAIVAKGVVYVGANDGYVYAFSADNGSLLWRTFTSISVAAVSSIGIQLKESM